MRLHSGDGTLRKNPQIWTEWNNEFAMGLHPLQLQLALRGVALLKALSAAQLQGVGGGPRHCPTLGKGSAWLRLGQSKPRHSKNGVVSLDGIGGWRDGFIYILCNGFIYILYIHGSATHGLASRSVDGCRSVG